MKALDERYSDVETSEVSSVASPGGSSQFKLGCNPSPRSHQKLGGMKRLKAGTGATMANPTSIIRSAGTRPMRAVPI
jgi:hypothetical protein